MQIDSHQRSTSSAELDRIVDDLTLRLQASESLELESVLAKYPSFAQEIRQLWPGLVCLANLGRSGDQAGIAWSNESSATEDISKQINAASDKEARVLGDFRILREIGRGGMGVVYEAQQISLDRRVALKVLPFAGILDDRQLQRFKNEARAVASLHHPHIVPVHAIGCERGVHYFAMQFIDGQSLAELLGRLRGVENSRADSPTSSQPIAADADTKQNPMTATMTSSVVSRDYCRSIVELGLQIADALAYAHSLGVVHRDIKPANLLLDSHGKVWVADFGLAQVDNDHGLTMSGDIVGTLKYMSPEQTLGIPGIVDQRTDVYSLGATLYELLTLRPLFENSSRHQLSQQIAHSDPTAPRKLNKKIDRELETILLKALEKNASDRYASASAMAEDMRRYLDGRAILAKPPGSIEVGWKWTLRHRGLVAAAFVTMLLTTIIACVGALAVWRESQRTTNALANAKAQTRVAQFQAARLALERSLAMCENGDVSQGLIWMTYALQICPEEQTEYQRVIRTNVNAWSRQVHPLEMILEHPQSVTEAYFANDDRYVVTNCRDGQVRIWDLGEPALSDEETVESFRARGSRVPKVVHTISPLPSPPIPNVICVHPKGKLVAIGDAESTLQVYDVMTGEPVGPPHPHSGAGGDRKAINSLAFSPDGELIICSSANAAVRFWPTNGPRARGKSMLDHRPVVAVGFTPDGGTALTIRSTTEILTWSVPTGDPIETLPIVLNESFDSMAWIDHGKTLVLGTQNFGAGVLDWETRTFTSRKFPHYAKTTVVATNEPRSLVATGSFDQTAKVWQWPSAEPLGAKLSHISEVTGIAFSSQGTWLTTVDAGLVKIWRIRSIQPYPSSVTPNTNESSPLTLAEVDQRKAAIVNRIKTLNTALPNYTHEIVVSPNQRLAALSPKRNSVQLWDVETDLPLGPALPSEAWNSNVQFSPDSATLFVSSVDSTIAAWDTSTLQLRWPRRQLPTAFREHVMLPDGKLLLGVAGDGRARFFDMASAVQIGPSLRHFQTTNMIVFSPDGQRVTTLDRDGTPLTWSVPQPIQGSPDEIQRLIESCVALTLDPSETVVHLSANEWKQRAAFVSVIPTSAN